MQDKYIKLTLLLCLTLIILIWDLLKGISYQDCTILVLQKSKSHFSPGRLFYVSLRGSMTNPPPSTMTPPVAANPPSANQQASTASSNPPATPVTKILVKCNFDLMLRVFFPTHMAPTWFNPITAMKQLFRTMLKDKLSLVLCTLHNDKQIILKTTLIPTDEKELKKFFHVSTTRIKKQNQTHVCIGCHVLSNWSLGSIKFRSKENQLLEWLKREWVFIESDSLGIKRPVTIGYFTKIAPDLTHLANFCNHLINQLMQIIKYIIICVFMWSIILSLL